MLVDVVRCWLDVVCCSSLVAWCCVFAVSVLCLFVGCALYVVRCRPLSDGASRLRLFVVCLLLFVVVWRRVVCCLMFAACCLMYKMLFGGR